MNFKVTSGSAISDEEVLAYAGELEKALGEIGNGKRNPKNIPIQPMVALIVYVRANVNLSHNKRDMSAIELYNEFGGDDELDPIERLRFFCSNAMANQNWLDVERFFDDVISERSNLQFKIDELMLEYCPADMSNEQLTNWGAHQRPSCNVHSDIKELGM